MTTANDRALDRRTFVVGGVAALAAPLAAEAQQSAKIPRVGYLFSFTRTGGEHLWDACREGLRELGYVEGRDMVLEPRWADGQHERLPRLVAELVRAKVDVIVAAATPANLAAKAGASTTPIVMVAVADPVGAGLIASLARPGGTVTGLSLLTPDLSGKRLALLLEVLPRNAKRIAVLTNLDNGSHEVFVRETTAAAKTRGIELQRVDARRREHLERSFNAVKQTRASGLIVFDDPVLWDFRDEIVALAARHGVPVMYGYREFTDEGGLMSYGPHRPDLYRRTAIYVDKLLKGAKPGDLPIEQPTRFEMIINVKAGRALGLTIPPSLLARADQVIE
jgi:putative tryptophan/tyrosine transport system substrate-binding protein